MARLVALSGERIGSEHAVSSPCVLGRAAHCSVRIDEESVSREHARLYERDGAWHVVDLNSRNGTFLNGRRVTKGEVRPGDELAVGRVRLRFAADAPEEAVVEEIELEDLAATAVVPLREEAPAPRLAPAPRPGPVLPVSPPATPPPAAASPPPRPAPSGKTLPSGVRRTAAGAILLAHEDAPGGALGEDLGQRGLLFRLGVLAGFLVLAAGIFFAAKLATQFFAPPAETAEGTGEPQDSGR
ncbi:MAG: FHA domain-containing protein [Planctomycetes bacterium]|nr:FHA domain-containing protein [Planctomycetota bacterium]